VVTVTGSFYQPNETVDIYWHSTGSTGTLLTTVIAEADGSFVTTITVPEASRGADRIIGKGQVSRAKPSRTFRINASAPANDTPAPALEPTPTETIPDPAAAPTEEASAGPMIVPADGSDVVDETEQPAPEEAIPTIETAPPADETDSSVDGSDTVPVENGSTDEGGNVTQPVDDGSQEPVDDAPVVADGQGASIPNGPANVLNVNASSFAIYDAPKAFDGDPSTAWIEGADGPGIGEFITVQFSETTHITSILVTNGFAANDALESAFGAPAELMVSTPDGNFAVLTLTRSLEPQRFDVDLTGDQLTITINSVIPGDVLTDAVAISEISFEAGPTTDTPPEDALPTDEGSVTTPDDQVPPADEGAVMEGDQPIMDGEGTPVAIDG
jgi:hypothetical protein